jgi:hypothetical protein
MKSLKRESAMLMEVSLTNISTKDGLSAKAGLL